MLSVFSEAMPEEFPTVFGLAMKRRTALACGGNMFLLIVEVCLICWTSIPKIGAFWWIVLSLMQHEALYSLNRVMKV